VTDLYVDQSIDQRVVHLLEAAGHRDSTPAECRTSRLN
jgi:hypothetical protein